MPELPEVETIRRDLEKVVVGKRIKEARIGSAKVIKEPDVKDFVQKIANRQIKEVFRRGKVLIFGLSTQYLVIHLRMTGQIIYGEREEESRISFLLSDGRYLNFLDQRLMGEVRLVDNWQEICFIRQMGPEPLEEEFTLKRFEEMIKGKKSKIKPLLMDQSFIAGIGNLYAVEILFRAGINPLRPANDLSLAEIKRLFSAIKEVLREGIEYRGSSVDTYRDAYGRKGGFEQRLCVYAREGQPCVKCAKPIKRVNLAGRGTYFCPLCQK
ncbi:MAG: formamidopyrimidine-DNA glycosylase [Candidatus Omnitrophota bacterium]|nr:MAG: formamidopyrimidine-DNA glycosylase [Candidatus Omnitrophota bacterium]